MRQKTGLSARERVLYHGIPALVILGLIIYGTWILAGEHYYLISIGVILTWLIGMLLSYEAIRTGAGFTVCLSVFIVAGVASRILLGPFPQVKPVAAVVILAGTVLGREAGAIAGMMTMFLSNFYFMQGAWTPFQMFAMGLIGYLAGMLFCGREFRHRLTAAVAVYGFFSVLLIYGGIVDINTVFFSLGENPTDTGVLTIYLAGLPFDLIFAVTTAILLVILTGPILKIWQRLEKKYEF